MKTWLDWLFGFFILAIADADGGDKAGGDDADAGDDTGDSDAGADAGGDDDADAGDAGSDDADLDLEAGADEADDGGTAAAAEAAKALRKAEDEAAELRRQLAARPAPAAGQTEDQRTHEAEEAEVRAAIESGASEESVKWLRWKNDSNRTIRETKRASGMALFQAQDISDKTAFNQLAVTKPAIHKRYAERVEAEIIRMRASGQNAPREAVLRYFIGNDALDGKLSSKKAAKVADTNTIDRGRSPGARSDVASRGRMTESQKREKRLEGVQI